MKVAGASARKPDAVRDAIRGMDDSKLIQLINKLESSTKAEQAALHFARNEQTRRRRNAMKLKPSSIPRKGTA